MSVLHVLFKIDDADYVVPASNVLHMETFTGATHVPGVPPYVVGLVQIRGRVLPVIDLRVRFGLPAHEMSVSSRLIVVQIGTRHLALLADVAREVVRIDPAELRAAPEMVGETGRGFVSAVGRTGKGLVMLLDVSRVVEEDLELDVKVKEETSHARK